MPTITLNKEVFEKLAGKKMPIEKLKERIAMLGTDLEKIEGNEITVEVFPNRPDMLSEQGFARAFSAFIGVKTGLRKYDVKKSGAELIVKDLPSQWPYAVACIVKGLKLDDEKIREIIQLQEKLGTTLTRNRKKGGIGLYPLEKISFPVTFIGMKPSEIKFRPLEFPKDISADEIREKHPKGKQYGYIMEGWEKYPVFVDSENNIMSMPPLINSHNLGKIDESTKDVFIECTGPDMNTIKVSLTILATSLADMGGKIESISVVYPKEKKTFNFPDLTPREMKLDVEYANKILGLELNKTQASELLGRMGYDVKKDPKGDKVLIPAWRDDILHQTDIAEDIAIAYGYENFEAIIPKVATVARESEFGKFKKKVIYLLVGLGMLELSTYHITNKRVLNDKMLASTEVIELENALTEDYSILRSWMLPLIMDVLSRNTHYEYPQNVFEIGCVFSKDKSTETGVREKNKLAVVLSSKEVDFTSIKQVVNYICSNLGIECSYQEFNHESFIKGRCANVIVNENNIGFLGEIAPEVLSNFNMEMPAVALELDVDILFRIVRNEN